MDQTRHTRRRAAVTGALLLGAAGSADADLLASIEAYIPTRAILEANTLAAKLAAQAKGLKTPVIKQALAAYRAAQQAGQVRRARLAVIDYSLPSSRKRLWVFDLDTEKLMFHEWVAHGVNSGMVEAKKFSNRLGSKQSSLGAFLTTETYYGRHGYSLNLAGLDPGVNDLAMRRRIVMHGAKYVSAQIIKEYGRLGRSWGCPAVRPRITQALIDTLKNGSVLFVYHPKLDAPQKPT